MARVKRTYNLPEQTVARVRELSEKYEVAPTQDAVIELAVDELMRFFTDKEEGDAWEAASKDPEWLAETAEIEHAFRYADRENWPAE
ncbi:MAG: hypothetical protein ABIZ34_02240 [Candidatus Limnocylindrales bacterium]